MYKYNFVKHIRCYKNLNMEGVRSFNYDFDCNFVRQDNGVLKNQSC